MTDFETKLRAILADFGKKPATHIHLDVLGLLHTELIVKARQQGYGKKLGTLFGADVCIHTDSDKVFKLAEQNLNNKVDKQSLIDWAEGQELTNRTKRDNVECRNCGCLTDTKLRLEGWNSAMDAVIKWANFDTVSDTPLTSGTNNENADKYMV